jgi:hypothetical protein
MSESEKKNNESNTTSTKESESKELVLVPTVVDGRRKTHPKYPQKSYRGPKPLAGKETLEQRMIFEEYVKMGDARSLVKLADLTKKPLPSLTTWSKKYKWQERLLALHDATSESMTIEPLDVQIRKKQLFVKLIDKMIENSIVVNKKGDIEKVTISLRNMADLRSALEIRDDILGNKKKSGPGFGTNIEKAVFIIKK